MRLVLHRRAAFQENGSVSRLPWVTRGSDYRMLCCKLAGGGPKQQLAPLSSRPHPPQRRPTFWPINEGRHRIHPHCRVLLPRIAGTALPRLAAAEVSTSPMHAGAPAGRPIAQKHKLEGLTPKRVEFAVKRKHEPGPCRGLLVRSFMTASSVGSALSNSASRAVCAAEIGTELLRLPHCHQIHSERVIE